MNAHGSQKQKLKVFPTRKIRVAKTVLNIRKYVCMCVPPDMGAESTPHIRGNTHTKPKL